MTNLVGTAGWDAIPQIETADQLVGGPGGKLNQQAQALLNYASALRQGRVITPIDPGVGCVGDGVANDYAALQGLITSLKKTSLNVWTPAAADAALSGVPRVTVDLMGKTYKVSQKLDFADLYYVTFRNGRIIADATATWNDDPVLYIAKPQSFDLDKIYRIQFVRFDGVTIDSNYVANGVYLENAFGITFDSDSVICRWKDNGYGLRSGPDSSTYVIKCGRLRLGRLHLWQVDLAASGLKTTSGSGIILRTSDFLIDGTKVHACDTACDIDNIWNAQIVALHTFVGPTQKCLVVGPNAHCLAITTFYADTGLVQFRSFSHTISNGIFSANSQVQFIAVEANEDMAGLHVDGIFAKQPQYLTEGSGSWAPAFKGLITGRIADGGDPPGQRVFGRGGITIGRQTKYITSIAFCDETTSDSNSGWYSPAAHEVAWSSQGTRAWGIDSSGRQFFGTQTASIQTLNGLDPVIQLNSTGANGGAQSATRWSSTAGFGGQLSLGRSNSDAIGTYSAVQANQVLGRLAFSGDNGTSINAVGAAITAKAFATWTSGSYGTNLEFWATPAGSTTLTSIWTMTTAGHLIPTGNGTQNIGGSSNRLQKIFSKDADFSGSVVFPGPYASDSAAATGGVAVNAAYRHTDGTVHWRQS